MEVRRGGEGQRARYTREKERIGEGGKVEFSLQVQLWPSDSQLLEVSYLIAKYSVPSRYRGHRQGYPSRCTNKHNSTTSFHAALFVRVQLEIRLTYSVSVLPCCCCAAFPWEEDPPTKISAPISTPLVNSPPVPNAAMTVPELRGGQYRHGSWRQRHHYGHSSPNSKTRHIRGLLSWK